MGTKRRTFLVHVLIDREESSKELMKDMVEKYHAGNPFVGLAVSLTEAESPVSFKQKADLVDLRMKR